MTLQEEIRERIADFCCWNRRTQHLDNPAITPYWKSQFLLEADEILKFLDSKGVRITKEEI